jgi:POT family proton-dependent oligopeptide transporter
MKRNVYLPVLGTVEILPSQIQALNPVLILLLAPLCTWVIYPIARRYDLLSTRGKIATGMVLAAFAFGIVGRAQEMIADGGSPSIWWQVCAYVVLTVAEVVVSITALEFAYTSAPSARRSLVTSFYLLSVSLGNALTALVVGPLAQVVGTHTTPRFFYFFGALSLISAIPAWRLVTAHQQYHGNE